MSVMTDKKPTVVKCKNCGSACTSRFCPDCGQPTNTARLDNKTFFIGMLAGLTRINQGFLYTAWQLLIHPWVVIRDYIGCRRVRYVPPVSMLIVVCFLSAVVSGLFPADASGEIVETGNGQAPLAHKMIMAVTDFLMNSMIVRNLTIYIPALLAIPIVYGGVGAKKYNVAEYFAAMIYMTSAFLLFSIVLSPLSLLSEAVYSALEILYTVLICSFALYQAFPMGSPRKRILYFLLFLIVVGLLYMLIMFGVATIIVYGE